MSDPLRSQPVRGRPVPPGARPPVPPTRSFPVGWVLLIALLVGVLVGISLALVSIFQPGALPALGAG